MAKIIHAKTDGRSLQTPTKPNGAQTAWLRMHRQLAPLGQASNTSNSPLQPDPEARRGLLQLPERQAALAGAQMAANSKKLDASAALHLLQLLECSQAGLEGPLETIPCKRCG